MENNRAVLLKRVQICDFVLEETALFLDTHPENKEALEYYHKYMEIMNKAKEEYTQKYGPLMRTDYDGGPVWTWATTAWPWEKEAQE